MTEAGLVRVVLLALPARLHTRANEHMDDIRREFELIRRSEGDPDSVPHRLHRLIDGLESGFDEFGTEAAAQIHEAVVRSQDAINLAYLVPPAAIEEIRRLDRMLEEVDEYCRSGRHLLTLATPPDAVRYRQWFTSEFVGQLTGKAPTSWPEFEARNRHGGSGSGQPDPARSRSEHQTDS